MQRAMRTIRYYRSHVQADDDRLHQHVPSGDLAIGVLGGGGGARSDRHIRDGRRPKRRNVRPAILLLRVRQPEV